MPKPASSESTDEPEKVAESEAPVEQNDEAETPKISEE
jgi:hypothetical protein